MGLDILSCEKGLGRISILTMLVFAAENLCNHTFWMKLGEWHEASPESTRKLVLTLTRSPHPQVPNLHTSNHCSELFPGDLGMFLNAIFSDNVSFIQMLYQKCLQDPSNIAVQILSLYNLNTPTFVNMCTGLFVGRLVGHGLMGGWGLYVNIEWLVLWLH